MPILCIAARARASVRCKGLKGVLRMLCVLCVRVCVLARAQAALHSEVDRLLQSCVV